jgi:hypothetical protein
MSEALTQSLLSAAWTFLGVALALVPGILAARCLLVDPGRGRWARLLGVGFALGLFQVTLGGFTANLLGVELSRGLFLGIVAAAALLWYCIGRFFLPKKGARQLETENNAGTQEPRKASLRVGGFLSRLLALVFGLLLIAQVGISVVSACVRPVGMNDAYTAWAFKAKAFYGERNCGPEVINLLDKETHRDHPLHVPLAATYVCLLRGGFDEYAIKTLSPLLFADLLVLIYGILASRVTPALAALCPLLFSLGPKTLQHSVVYYADLPVSISITLAAAALLEWHQWRSIRSLVLIGAAAALAAWTKNEGVAFLVVTVAAVPLRLPWSQGERLPSIGRYLVFLAVPSLLLLPWLWFRLQIDLGIEDLRGLTLQDLLAKAYAFPERWSYIARGLAKMSWLPIPVMALTYFAGILDPKAFRQRSYGGVELLLLGQTLFYVAFYLFLAINLKAYLASSLGRITLHLMPCALIVLALRASPGLSKQSSTS